MHRPYHGGQVVQGRFAAGAPRFTVQSQGSAPQSQAAPHVQAALQQHQPVLQRLAGPPLRQGVLQVPASINLAKTGPGQPLPPAVQQKMEALFGAAFSDVRIYEGPQAASIGAVAFTMGSDVYFAPGAYAPQSAHGQRLIGHELTHVMQQRAGRVRNPFGSGVAVVQDPGLEAEADRMAQRAATPPQPVQARMDPARAHAGPDAAGKGAAAQAKPHAGGRVVQRDENPLHRKGVADIKNQNWSFFFSLSELTSDSGNWGSFHGALKWSAFVSRKLELTIDHSQSKDKLELVLDASQPLDLGDPDYRKTHVWTPPSTSYKTPFGQFVPQGPVIIEDPQAWAASTAVTPTVIVRRGWASFDLTGKGKADIQVKVSVTPDGKDKQLATVNVIAFGSTQPAKIFSILLKDPLPPLDLMARMKLAFEYSIPHWPAGVAHAAAALFTDPYALGILAMIITVQILLFFAPDPSWITKALVAVFFAALLVKFGVDTVMSAAKALKNLHDRCKAALSMKDLKHAGELLAKEGGEPLFNVLSFIVTLRISRGVRKHVSPRVAPRIAKTIGKTRSEIASWLGLRRIVPSWSRLDRMVRAGGPEGLTAIRDSLLRIKIALRRASKQVQLDLAPGESNWVKPLQGKLNSLRDSFEQKMAQKAPSDVQFKDLSGYYNDLIAIWSEFNVIPTYPGFSGTKMISYGSDKKRKSLEIDNEILAGEGWVEIKSWKLFGKKAGNWSELKKKVEKMLEAGQEWKVSDIRVRFVQGVYDEIVFELQKMGVKVEGDIVPMPKSDSLQNKGLFPLPVLPEDDEYE